jgi:hypothetical protein
VPVMMAMAAIAVAKVIQIHLCKVVASATLWK